jgi:aromatic-L-amino-acid decarboxylase
MPPIQEDPELVDFCEISPELSRGFRGLKVWLPLKRHGLGAFREALDEKLDLAAEAHAALRTMPGVEIVAPPQLSVVAWRWRPDVPGEVDLDDLNRRLLREINLRQRVYLTGTRLNGQFVIRICVLSFRTHADRMASAIEDISRSIDVLGAQFEGA